MIRLCAVLLYVVLRLAVKIAVDTLVGLWLKYRPIRRWRTRRAKRAEHPDEIVEDFNSQPDEVSMDAVKGALRSRLIWLGVAQVVYGLVQLWADGMLTIESAGPVLGGAVTIWLRAVTKDSLADKAK
jgi:hypothetical protein